MKRPSPYLLLKLAVTFGLVGLLVWQADFSRVWPQVQALRAEQLAVAVALHVVAFLFGALRWWLLLRHQLPEIGFRSILPSYYMGVFANNVLPTSVGGDAARTLHLHLLRIPLEALVSSALVDRAVGLGAVFLMAGVALTLFPHEPAARQVGLGVLVLVVIGAGIAAFALSGTARRWVERLSEKVGHRRVIGFLVRAVADCQRYRSRPALLVLALALSLVIQSLVVLVYARLASGMEIPVGLGQFLYVIPIVFLASNMPISLGGLGVREGVLVGLLSLFAIATDAAVGLSLAYLAVLWIAAFPGAIALLFLRRSGNDEAPEASP